MDRVLRLGGRLPTPPPATREEASRIDFPPSDDEEDLPEEFHTLDRAACSGDLDTVKAIMERERPPHALMEQLPNDKLTYTMHGALSAGHPEVVKYMIKEGTPFNNTHADIATASQYFNILDVMLEKGWNINSFRSKGKPAMLAEYLDNDRVVDYYLNHGADPNARGIFDRTVLSSAIHKHPYSLVIKLFEHGGSVQRGQLMHFCALRLLPDSTQVADLLVEKGYTDLNAIMYKDHEPSWEFHRRVFLLGTPLKSAAEIGNLPMIEWLLQHGADPNIPDTEGRLPIDDARRNHHVKVVLAFDKWSKQANTA